MLVGYGFGRHPMKPEPWWVQITVYYNRNGLVMCTSEGCDEQRSMELGSVVRGELVAPYAQRNIAGNIDQAFFSEFKRLLSVGDGDSPPLSVKFHWLGELPALP